MRWVHLLGMTVLAVMLLVAAIVWLLAPRSFAPVPTGHVTAPTCGRDPAVVAAMPPPDGLRGTISRGFSTAQADPVGLTVFYRDEAGTTVYRQAETWDDAGPLGAFVRTADGTLYAAPAPGFGAIDSVAQNTLWRLDPTTGIFAPFVALPVHDATTPFGLVAVAVDCKNNHVLAATVNGSDATSVRGEIVAIDPNGRITPLLIGVDALALAIVESDSGRHLLASHARSAQIVALALDGQGRIRTQPVVVADVPTAAPDLRVRRIGLTDDGSLALTLVPFTFTRTPADPAATQTIVLPRRADQWAMVSP